MRELRLRRLAVVLDRADAAAERDPDDDRHLDPALGAEVDLGDLADDLVVGRVDEAVELDLDDRPVAAHRHADRGADDAGLGQRAVDDAVLAEVLLQSVGDPEDAAELADVLTHDQDLRVVLHRLAQPHVEALGERDLLGHVSALPSNDSRYAANSSCCCAQLVGLLGVDHVEDVERLRVGQRLHAVAEPGAEVVGLAGHLVEEGGVGQAVALEVGLDPGDRVLELPATRRRRRAGSGSGRRSWCARPCGRCRPRRSVGPWPSRARCSAAWVTAYVASTSLPSTRTPGKPKPSARW